MPRRPKKESTEKAPEVIALVHLSSVDSGLKKAKE
jgi:hypothetical protein